MAAPDSNKIVVWYDFFESGFIRFYFRGIKASGEFYGEIQDSRQTPGYQRELDGRLSVTDNDRFQSLSAEIEASCKPSDTLLNRGDVRGWIGVWPLSAPRILVRYVAGDECHSEAARKFLEICKLLRPVARRILDQSGVG